MFGEPSSIASGYVEQGHATGKRVPTVTGCRCIKGPDGLVSIDSYGNIPREVFQLTLTPGPGTNPGPAAHTVTFGVAMSGQTVLSVNVKLDGVSTDLAFWFEIRRRPLP